MKPSVFFYMLLIFFLGCLISMQAQQQLLIPDRVFDGEQTHEGWAVLIEDGKILRVGPAERLNSAKASVLKLEGCTLLPGLIEGHSHLLLHPYNETPWADQVMKELDGLRVARGTVHARKTLLAGFTTVRDLGSEGAGYSDIGLKQAIEEGIIAGPRMIVAGRAIVATGSYGPAGFDTDFKIMLGAEEADGDNLIRVTRDQIGKGVDIVKVYADYRWGAGGKPQPTFSVEELTLVVETAKSSGRQVVAHASTAEGMRRATLAGVSTIEHGDGGTPEVFKLMKERGVALCPTLAAAHAVSQYNGWKSGVDPEPARVKLKRETFKEAMKANVTICAGGDAGVFAHGDNIRELELMVNYGMSPENVLRAATSVNAHVFSLDSIIGKIAVGLKADILVVKGNPIKNVADLRNVRLVLKDGVVYKN